MPEPLLWRLFRTACWMVVLGFSVAVLVEFWRVSTVAEGPGKSLGKPEVYGLLAALLAAPLILAWRSRREFRHFCIAFTVLAAGWLFFDLVSQLSSKLHHPDPIFVEILALPILYAGLVPWTSWLWLVRVLRVASEPVQTGVP